MAENKETEPLLKESKEDEESYGGADEVNGRGYDIEKLVSLSVFSVFDGTVFKSRTLWMETALNGVIYWSVFIGVYNYRWKGFSDFVGKESTIRAFIAMFSTLIGLLLSFYTALNLGRWWQMRLSVQHIVEGNKKLIMMVAQCHSDPVVLATMNRYARASMFLIFAASQMEEGDEKPVHKAVKKGLLTQEECEKLQKASPHLTFVQAETLWVWLASWVTKLHNAGCTKGPPHYCALMGSVEEGRQGVANIQSYLETPIPLGYVHLLCLMVKLHNMILNVLMAMASVMLAGGAGGFDQVGVCRTAFRAFFMPFLYNAILILNSDITDPFGGDASDFDWTNYDANLRLSSESFVQTVDNLPKCIGDWTGTKESKV